MSPSCTYKTRQIGVSSIEAKNSRCFVIVVIALYFGLGRIPKTKCDFASKIPVWQTDRPVNQTTLITPHFETPKVSSKMDKCDVFI